MDRKRGREDWEGGCTAVREPWCHVNNLVTSNLHPCIDQYLLQRNVHIWKLMYCCPDFLLGVLWRLGNNPELRDFLLTALYKLVCITEKSFRYLGMQSCHHVEMLSIWAVFWHHATSIHPAEGLTKVRNLVSFREDWVFLPDLLPSKFRSAWNLL